MARAAVVEAQGAGLGADRDVEVRVGGLRQGRAGVSGERDDGRPQPLQPGHEDQDLLGVAALRHRDQHVTLHDPAEVAVRRLGGVQEERGAARGGQGRRDLLGDDPALAHPGHYHAAGAGEQRLHRPVEALVEAGDQLPDRLGLDLEDPAGGVA
jgi:hypothetical protein